MDNLWDVKMSIKELLKKIGFSWSFSDFFYRYDRRKPDSKSLKTFLTVQVDKANSLSTLPTFKGSHDEIMNKAFFWIEKNIVYISDQTNYGISEFWAPVEQIMVKKSGDCEDMSILLFCIARKLRVSPLQIRLVCGLYEDEFQSNGHAWIEYLSDASYYATPAPWTENKYWTIYDPAMARVINFEDARYKKRWFSVSDFSW